MNDGRLIGMFDSQVRVVADKQVAQITADRGAIASISFEPLQRTSLMIRTRVYLGTDHLQCENHRLKRIDATGKMRPFLAWPIDLISADPHALIVFWLEQTNWYLCVARRAGYDEASVAISTAAPLEVLLQMTPSISVSCEPRDDYRAMRNDQRATPI